MPSKPLTELAAQAESMASPVGRASDLHGPKHWRAVAQVAALLLAEAPEADSRSLFIFACLHDTQRLNHGTDPEHGARAAMVLDELEHGLNPERLERLRLAIRDHSGAGSTSHEDPTIGACWDADRLTLDRVGIRPEHRYISTPTVRDRLERFRNAAREISEGPDRTWDEIAAAFERPGPPREGTDRRLVASDFYGYLRPSRCGLRVWLREQGDERRIRRGVQPRC